MVSVGGTPPILCWLNGLILTKLTHEAHLMSQRAHLFSLSIGHALRATFRQGYSKQDLSKDLLAGVTVGIISIPLAMALAIAVGVPPQYGLFTAIIGGFVIALSGGSFLSVSGPTAAFVVILLPITQTYGLSGLLIATFMAGVMLVLLAVLRLGRFIEFIPAPVTLGFTAGIAVVIVLLQLKGLFGLPEAETTEGAMGHISHLIHHWRDIHLPTTAISVLTIAVLLAWQRWGKILPPHLVALLLIGFLAVILQNVGLNVETINSQFSWFNADGMAQPGIPPNLPTFVWPWQATVGNEVPTGLSLALIVSLLPSAFAIAMLGAIESLLCAVVVDKMIGKKHSANSELLGQGIGNMIVPFFGGIPATAAIARSATNVKTGGKSPIAAATHAVVVLISLLFFTDLLGYLPMAAMSALLIIVAWNMSEAHKVIELIKTAPKRDILVFLTCFLLTIFIDMVYAITFGIMLASILFVHQIAGMTLVKNISNHPRLVGSDLQDGWSVYKIVGPLFFAAADRVFEELIGILEDDKQNAMGIILYLDAVPVLDAGGTEALWKFNDYCKKNNLKVIYADWQKQPQKTLARLRKKSKSLDTLTRETATLNEALSLSKPTSVEE